MARVADRLCPQAAARPWGASGGGGRGALHCGAPGRPQLCRVRSAVRAPSRTATPPTPENLSRSSVTLGGCCHALVCCSTGTSRGRLPFTSLNKLVGAGAGMGQTPTNHDCPSFQLRLLQTCHSAGPHRQHSECSFPSWSSLASTGGGPRSLRPSLPTLAPPQRFRALCSRERLLASFGDNMVRLSTANTYSYQKGELPHLAAQPACQHPGGSIN